MAPEYAMEGVYSIKSDVFSFGVLLLEIITGKRNAGFHQSKRAPSLLAYVSFLVEVKTILLISELSSHWSKKLSCLNELNNHGAGMATME